ncbi:MAG: hypothetical protein Q9170_005702, partial [Blastenia crenularia]
MSSIEFPPNPPPASHHNSFPFFSLPSELRSKILSSILCTETRTIDLDPKNHLSASTRLNLFLVSKRFGYEAYHIFYSGHTFRIFQTHGRFLGKRTEPLLARLPSYYRAALVSLELRLGPGWSDPPKPWYVSDRLGLEDCTSVRTLRVFVEVDPSSPVFKGFRLNRDFFTHFSGDLLRGVIERLPVLETVEFDAYPSVDRHGALVTRLLDDARRANKRIAWGSQRDWGDSLADKLEKVRLKARQGKPFNLSLPPLNLPNRVLSITRPSTRTEPSPHREPSALKKPPLLTTSPPRLPHNPTSPHRHRPRTYTPHQLRLHI